MVPSDCRRTCELHEAISMVAVHPTPPRPARRPPRRPTSDRVARDGIFIRTSLAAVSDSVKLRPTRARDSATRVAVGGTSTTTTLVGVVWVAPSASVTVSVAMYVAFCAYVLATASPVALVPSPKFHS
jgi:hypothetical protein